MSAHIRDHFAEIVNQVADYLKSENVERITPTGFPVGKNLSNSFASEMRDKTIEIIREANYTPHPENLVATVLQRASLKLSGQPK